MILGISADALQPENLIEAYEFHITYPEQQGQAAWSMHLQGNQAQSNVSTGHSLQLPTLTTIHDFKNAVRGILRQLIALTSEFIVHRRLCIHVDAR